jgi:hypothetical protein
VHALQASLRAVRLVLPFVDSTWKVFIVLAHIGVMAVAKSAPLMGVLILGAPIGIVVLMNPARGAHGIASCQPKRGTRGEAAAAGSSRQ